MFLKYKEKVKNRKDIFIGIVCISILLWVGYDILNNLVYFYIDNPSVLVFVKNNMDKMEFGKNPRLDFMYNIIVVCSGRLFGNTPTVHFAVQYFIYLISIGCVFYFCWLYQRSVRISIFCASLMLWCTPVAENLYTIGKKEIFLTTGISIIILCLYKIMFSNISSIKRNFVFMVYTTSVLFCLTLKETSFIIILPSIMLLLYCFIFSKEHQRKALASLGIFILVWAIIQLYKKNYIVESPYTSYQITLSSVMQSVIYYCKYHWDVALLGGVGFISNLILVKKNNKNMRGAYLLILNITGWGYWFGICLWRWTQSYYIYPCIVFFGTSLIGIAFLLNKHIVRHPLWVKGMIGVCVVIIGTYSLIYNYCVAISHKDLGKIYTQSIEELDCLVESGDRVLIDNANLYEEPPYQMSNLLTRYLENDIVIWGIRQNLIEENISDETLALYGFDRKTYEEMLKEASPKKGDYIVDYINYRNFYGPIRAVNPSNSKDFNERLSAMGYELEPISKKVINREYLGFENGRMGVHLMQSGYQILQIKDFKFIIKGLGEDGWCEEQIIIENYSIGDKCSFIVRDIGTTINGLEKNSISIWIDNKLYKEIEVKNGSIIDLNSIIDGEASTKHNIILKIKHTFVPSRLIDSDDTRTLGINVEIMQ